MNSNAFDLTIIVPFYNGESFIFTLLNSLDQSYYKSNKKINYEVLLIVDSPNTNLIELENKISGFETGEICILVNEMNIGVALSRDAGILRAKGELITFIDQDDSVTESYFNKIENCYDENVDLYIQNGYVKSLISNKIVPIFYFKPKFSFTNFLIDNHVLTPSLLIVKRSFIQKNGIFFRLPFDDYKGVDDWFFILQILQITDYMSVKYINNYSVNYCIHTTNYSNNVEEAIQASILLMKYFRGQTPTGSKLINRRINGFRFLLDIHSKNRTKISNIVNAFDFLILYLSNFNRLIRLLHRRLIGLRIRI